MLSVVRMDKPMLMHFRSNWTKKGAPLYHCFNICFRIWRYEL